ncbi:MAG: prolyl oligopeptidase family serine peptidase [Saprospiraceae bacterium]|nr:prolyl oligopeptidase family serine peptidase [Saprospiraceae bacterium]
MKDINWTPLLCCLGLTLFVALTGQAQTSQQQIGAENPPFSLDEVQKRHFLFFWDLAHKSNYQVPDRYPMDNFSSIAATGFGLSAYLVGAERGWITRAQCAERVLNTLQFLKNLPQGPEASGVAGYKGWFYHFLNTADARRFKTVELSSIDTGLLMAGVLSCMTYFDRNNPTERAIRETADFLYRRVDFNWFMNEHHRLSMGWFQELDGFLAAEWSGYNEAMILNIMALGSPTHPVPGGLWQRWCDTYYRANFKGQDHVNFGPLFGHQYSHCWIDFRGIQDDYCRRAGFDYFENSRRAVLAQRQYGIENPGKFAGYGPDIWGLTAGDGPDAEMTHQGRKIFCPGYSARGVAIDYLDDDGTIAPTAAIASLPFAPEVCLPALEAMWKRWPVGPYGFFDGYNETFTDLSRSPNAQAGYPFWVDRDYLGIDQGPIVLMIENYRSGFLWDLMKRNPYIVNGLKRAGFKGGWIDKSVVKSATDEDDFPGPMQGPNPNIPLDPDGFFTRGIIQDKTGHSLPYRLAVPTHETGKKFPLVIFLHGSGERGTFNKEQMTNGVHAFCEKDFRKKHPHYLLVPQCPPGDRWGPASADWPDLFHENPTTTGQLLLDLIDKTMRENPDIDPSRVYITGLSMGGFGTIDMLMRRPDLFAAAMPVCGGGDVRYAERVKNVPMWVFHGALDETVPPRCSKAFVNALQSVGSQVKYTELSTLAHGIWYSVYYNPNVLEWLFAQKK